VRCAEYAPGGRHAVVAEAALEVLGNTAMALLLANHGVIIAGRSVAEATVATEVLEKAAMIYVLAESFSKCHSIPSELVEEERHRYLYKYGNAADFAEE
jgi:ribulose-5-phosphate 4-epimerase/fuculose-1-phosphate aldolase